MACREGHMEHVRRAGGGSMRGGQGEIYRRVCAGSRAIMPYKPAAFQTNTSDSMVVPWPARCSSQAPNRVSCAAWWIPAEGARSGRMALGRGLSEATVEAVASGNEAEPTVMKQQCSQQPSSRRATRCRRASAGHARGAGRGAVGLVHLPAHVATLGCPASPRRSPLRPCPPGCRGEDDGPHEEGERCCVG